MYGVYKDDRGKLRDAIKVSSTVSLDFSALSVNIRNALAKSVEAGVLTSRTGKTAQLYDMLQKLYKWPEPHVWTPNCSWSSVKIRADSPTAAEEVKPYLLLMYPPPDYEVYLWGDWVRVESAERSRMPLSDAGFSKPALGLVDVLKKHDPRDRNEVLGIVDTVLNKGTIQWGLEL